MGQTEAKLLGRVAAHFAESARLKLQAAETLGAPVARGGVLLAESLKNGGKALACGNGGSAADAQLVPYLGGGVIAKAGERRALHHEPDRGTSILGRRDASPERDAERATRQTRCESTAHGAAGHRSGTHRSGRSHQAAA